MRQLVDALAGGELPCRWWICFKAKSVQMTVKSTRSGCRRQNSSGLRSADVRGPSCVKTPNHTRDETLLHVPSMSTGLPRVLAAKYVRFIDNFHQVQLQAKNAQPDGNSKDEIDGEIDGVSTLSNQMRVMLSGMEVLIEQCAATALDSQKPDVGAEHPDTRQVESSKSFNAH
eukprot:3767990-Amphidinium_carterae.1